MQTRRNEKVTSAKLDVVKNSANIKTNSSLDFKKKVEFTKKTSTSNPHEELKQRHKSFVLNKTSPTKK